MPSAALLWTKAFTLVAAIATALVLLGGIATSADALEQGGYLGETEECADVLFVGVRGSSQTSNEYNGFGFQVDAIRAGLLDTLAASDLRIRAHAIDYPAAPVGDIAADLFAPFTGTNFPYFDSIDAGVAELTEYLAAQEHCPDEKWVLAGYSQGALVVHHATNSGYSDPDRVAGVLLVADPFRDAQAVNIGTAQSGGGLYESVNVGVAAMDPRILDRTTGLCNEGDLVCDTMNLFGQPTLIFPLPTNLVVQAAEGYQTHVTYEYSELRALGAAPARQLTERPGVFDAPRDVQAVPSDTGETSVRLSWAAPYATGESEITSYRVVTQPTTGSHALPPASTGLVLDMLSPGANAFTIYAINGAGQTSATTAIVNLRKAGSTPRAFRELPPVIDGVVTLTPDVDWYLRDTTIEVGGELRMGPGVHIRSLSRYGQPGALKVLGSLVVQGSEASPVRFSSSNGLEPGLDPAAQVYRDPILGDWSGIWVGSGASVVMDHADIGYAATVLDYDRLGATGSSTTVTNTVIHDVGSAVQMSAENAFAMRNSRLVNAASRYCGDWWGGNCTYWAGAQVALSFGGGAYTPSITDTTIVDASTGISVQGNVNATMDGVSFADVGSDGLGSPVRMAATASASVTRNTTVVNGPREITVSGDLAPGSTTWSSDMPYKNGGVVVPVDSELVLPAGAVVRSGPNYTPSIQVLGSLFVEGAASAPVRLTSADLATPTIGDWSGIWVGSGASVVMDHADIGYASTVLDYDRLGATGSSTTVTNTVINDVGGAVKMSAENSFSMRGSLLFNAAARYCPRGYGYCSYTGWGGPEIVMDFGGGAYTPSITDTTIASAKYGIILRDSVNATIERSQFTGIGSAAVGNSGTGQVSASPNWWSDPSGPAPVGAGMATVGSVLVSPWCLDAACTSLSTVPDVEAPVVTGTADESSNVAGWFNTPLTVSWAATDEVDGGLPAPPAVVLGEGADQTASSSEVCDTAGNCTIGSFGPVSVDLSPPVITASVSGIANGAGWRNEETTVTFECSDELSGIASCPGSVVLADGADRVVAVEAVDVAGNSTPLSIDGLNVDTLAPALSAQLGEEPNSAGWYSGDITVRWVCSDELSGIAENTCPADSTVAGEGKDLTAGALVLDRAGNTTQATSPPVDIDRTAPATSVSAPTGWNGADVTVELTALDNLSGAVSTTWSLDGGDPVVAELPPPFEGSALVEQPAGGTKVDVTGDGRHVLRFYSADAAGNLEEPVEIEIFIDTAGPGITHTLSREANDAGWHREPVTISFTCADTSSGIRSCPDSVVLTDDGATQVVTGTAVDSAGNESVDLLTVNLDQTPPTIAALLGAAPNAAGWFNVPVPVSWSCGDTVSGIATCADGVTLIQSSPGPVIGQAVDVAGNVSEATLERQKIDTTTPIVAITGVTDGGTYDWGAAPIPACEASDALSGLEGSCEITVSGGMVGGTGDLTATATATDRAGNTSSATATYTVRPWTLRGFYSPVKMDDAWNSVRAGVTTRLKFEVFQGATELKDPAVVATATAQQITCNARTPIGDRLVIPVSGLRYGGGKFAQDWTTPRQPGNCYEVTVSTKDGSNLSALLQLK